MSIYWQEPTDLPMHRSLISHKFWMDKNENSQVFYSWVPYCCGQPLWYHNNGCYVSSEGKEHRASILSCDQNKPVIKHMSVKGFESVSVVYFAFGVSATKGAALSTFDWKLNNTRIT